MKRGVVLSLPVLREQIIACERCSRLRKHCNAVARVKRRAYLDWEYWGKPVPPLGGATAKLLIVGLAPGAHGANRTGRMFTGDRSADFLFRALYDTGFASQPTSVSREDGLQLIDSYITCAVRCAPPDNKPLPVEAARCRPFLERELDLLRDVRVVVALGRFGFDAYLSILQDRGVIERRSAFDFGHGTEHELGEGQPLLIGSYHPSQQNTSTGKLTQPMLRSVFERAREVLSKAQFFG
ncbi:MAG: uracil-DNA glycosylase [Bryobacteraceae bacterium]